MNALYFGQDKAVLSVCYKQVQQKADKKQENKRSVKQKKGNIVG